MVTQTLVPTGKGGSGGAEAVTGTETAAEPQDAAAALSVDEAPDDDGIEFAPDDEPDAEDRAFLEATAADNAGRTAETPTETAARAAGGKATTQQRKRIKELLGEVPNGPEIVSAAYGTGDPAKLSKGDAFAAIRTLEAVASTGQGALT
jgi:hypothetical protein